MHLKEMSLTVCDCAIKEVLDFHKFLVNAFAGNLDDDPLVRLAGFHRNFTYILPEGGVIGYETLSGVMPSWRGAQPNIQIAIKILQSYQCGEDSCIVLYEEHQVGAASGDNSRISSALFLSEPAAPSGVVWRHLHESWLPNQTDI